MSTPRSIVIGKAAPDVFEIRGCTHPHIELFKALGCTWQGRKLLWIWQGATLPEALQQLADGVYGLKSPETPVLAPQATTVAKTAKKPIAPKLRKPASQKSAGVKAKKETAPKKGFATAAKVTPLRAQYLRLKADWQTHILLYRLGDFYETFDDDAKLAALDCDLVLTARPVSKTERIPMAGFPAHALDTYLSLLVKAGRKVAIAEQGSKPDGSGIVERSVVRVINHEGEL